MPIEFEVADKLFRAIEAHDVNAVADVYADDIQVWHNFSNATQSKSENLAALTAMTETVPVIEYAIVERHMVAGRVLQRHNLKCQTDSGEQFVIPACMFITIQSNKITRIEEYLDSGQANALRIASGREPLS